VARLQALLADVTADSAAAQQTMLYRAATSAFDGVPGRYQREMQRLTVQLRNKKEAVRAAERDAEVCALRRMATTCLNDVRSPWFGVVPTLCACQSRPGGGGTW
jgi:hypothetical protein